MAYGVAVAAGGDLKIDSRVGKGTTITLLLPSVDDEPDAVAAATKPVARVAPARIADILWSTTFPRSARHSQICSGPGGTAWLRRATARTPCWNSNARQPN